MKMSYWGGRCMSTRFISRRISLVSWSGERVPYPPVPFPARTVLTTVTSYNNLRPDTPRQPVCDFSLGRGAGAGCLGGGTTSPGSSAPRSAADPARDVITSSSGTVPSMQRTKSAFDKLQGRSLSLQVPELAPTLDWLQSAGRQIGLQRPALKREWETLKRVYSTTLRDEGVSLAMELDHLAQNVERSGTATCAINERIAEKMSKPIPSLQQLPLGKGVMLSAAIWEPPRRGSSPTTTENGMNTKEGRWAAWAYEYRRLGLNEVSSFGEGSSVVWFSGAAKNPVFTELRVEVPVEGSLVGRRARRPSGHGTARQHGGVPPEQQRPLVSVILFLRTVKSPFEVTATWDVVFPPIDRDLTGWRNAVIDRVYQTEVLEGGGKVRKAERNQALMERFESNQMRHDHVVEASGSSIDPMVIEVQRERPSSSSGVPIMPRGPPPPAVGSDLLAGGWGSGGSGGSSGGESTSGSREPGRAGPRGAPAGGAVGARSPRNHARVSGTSSGLPPLGPPGAGPPVHTLSNQPQTQQVDLNFGADPAAVETKLELMHRAPVGRGEINKESWKSASGLYSMRCRVDFLAPDDGAVVQDVESYEEDPHLLVSFGRDNQHSGGFHSPGRQPSGGRLGGGAGGPSPRRGARGTPNDQSARQDFSAASAKDRANTADGPDEELQPTTLVKHIRFSKFPELVALTHVLIQERRLDESLPSDWRNRVPDCGNVELAKAMVAGGARAEQEQHVVAATPTPGSEIGSHGVGGADGAGAVGLVAEVSSGEAVPPVNILPPVFGNGEGNALRGHAQEIPMPEPVRASVPEGLFGGGWGADGTRQRHYPQEPEAVTRVMPSGGKKPPFPSLIGLQRGVPSSPKFGGSPDWSPAHPVIFYNAGDTQQDHVRDSLADGGDHEELSHSFSAAPSMFVQEPSSSSAAGVVHDIVEGTNVHSAPAPGRVLGGTTFDEKSEVAAISDVQGNVVPPSAVVVDDPFLPSVAQAQRTAEDMAIAEQQTSPRSRSTLPVPKQNAFQSQREDPPPPGPSALLEDVDLYMHVHDHAMSEEEFDNEVHDVGSGLLEMLNVGLVDRDMLLGGGPHEIVPNKVDKVPDYDRAERHAERTSKSGEPPRNFFEQMGLFDDSRGRKVSAILDEFCTKGKRHCYALAPQSHSSEQVAAVLSRVASGRFWF